MRIDPDLWFCALYFGAIAAPVILACLWLFYVGAGSIPLLWLAGAAISLIVWIAFTAETYAY